MSRIACVIWICPSLGDDSVSRPERRLGNTKGFYHMHVPQTPGGSFCTDILLVSPPGSGMFSWEACYVDFLSSFEVEFATENQKADAIVTIVREPLNHVYLQYLHCSKIDVDAGGDGVDHHRRLRGSDRKLHNMNFSNVSLYEWLVHFNGDVFQTDDHDCYNPFNMQTRIFTCKHPEDPRHDDGNHSDQDLNNALKNANETWFVGVSEYYQESLCVFIDKSQLSLPVWCNCEDPEKWGEYKGSRAGVSEANFDPYSLSDDELRMMRALTQNDQVLYEAAVERLREEVRTAEERHTIKIWCK